MVVKLVSAEMAISISDCPYVMLAKHSSQDVTHASVQIYANSADLVFTIIPWAHAPVILGNLSAEHAHR